jgi:hypothetical protein
MDSNVIIDHPIICPHCKQESGYTHEGIMFLYIACDLLCHKCGKIVIYANNNIS